MLSPFDYKDRCCKGLHGQRTQRRWWVQGTNTVILWIRSLEEAETTQSTGPALCKTLPALFPPAPSSGKQTTEPLAHLGFRVKLQAGRGDSVARPPSHSRPRGTLRASPHLSSAQQQCPPPWGARRRSQACRFQSACIIFRRGSSDGSRERVGKDRAMTRL